MNPTKLFVYVLLAAVSLSVPASGAVEKSRDYRLYTDSERARKAAFLIDSFPAGDAAGFAAVVAEMNYLSDKAAFLDVIDIGRAVYDRAEANGDDKLRMYTATYIGYACVFTNRIDSMRYYLDAALELGLKTGDHFTIARVYNAQGIYYLTVEPDYIRSLRYFHMALDEAEEGSRDYLYPQILGNLAMTYYYRNDPAGIEYAREAYTIGKRDDNFYILFVGALSSAYMYYIMEDYPQALTYINEAVPYAENNSAATAVYTLYGDILLAMDRRREALSYYEKALQYTGNAQFTETTHLYLRLGDYYLLTGQPMPAIDILERGVRFAQDNNVSIYRYKLYQSLSEAYRRVGNSDRALDLYMVYHRESDSLFNIERERSLNELRIAYESEKREKELREKETQVVVEQKRANSILFISLFIIAFVLLIAVSVWVLYRRRYNMYMQMVKQYQDYTRREQRLTQSHRPVAAGEEGDEAKYSSSALTEEKGLELFRRLEEKMGEGHLFRDSALTVEKLAEELGTNRTYLSQVINDFAGESFYNYIYSYRVDDAVKMLTGGGDKPLKSIAYESGFSSLNTFYVKFREKMGMPPSKFRENWLKLNERK